MKKLLIGLAVVAFAFTLTSCNKNCECKLWAAGIAGDPYEVELEKGKKCKDLNTYITDSNGEHKTGVECK